MQLPVAYHGRSGVVGTGDRRIVAMQPNLSRELVAMDAALKSPVRFREAMSALHDIVVSDLRYKKRDKSAYHAWKAGEQARDQQVRRDAVKAFRQEQAESLGLPPPTAEEQARFREAIADYWKARRSFARDVRKNDPALWRLIMPCDPVVTVADDVVFFECFSADESSYGCLTVDRDGLKPSGQVARGTTNVDYSWQLYDHFQSLRSYRQTRLHIDPEGFGASTEAAGSHIEEKIDLPAGWLRGFLQVQAATALPMKRVSLSRDCVYSLLAFMKRNKPRKSPRAMRFELSPGKPATITLEPWEKEFKSRSGPYIGPECEPIRLWGTRRLMFLARVLPLAERFDVYLLGSGLPSFWVARMGDMRLTVGNSGWTANDWTAGSPLDAMRPPVELSDEAITSAAAVMHERRSLRRDQLAAAFGCEPAEALALVDALAHRGQVIYDLVDEVYRYRSIMPTAVAEDQLGPTNAEAAAAKELLRRGAVAKRTITNLPNGGVRIEGLVDHYETSITLSADSVLIDGRCGCSYFHKNGIRRGPCRHMIALRDGGPVAASVQSWYDSLRAWSAN